MGLERVYIDQNDFISIELFSDDEVYILRDSSSREFIGISVLSVHDTNPIRFKVVDKYQGHGYGKQILKESLEIMKNKVSHYSHSFTTRSFPSRTSTGTWQKPLSVACSL